MALVVGLSANRGNEIISQENLVLLLKDMLGDIPIYFVGFVYFEYD